MNILYLLSVGYCCSGMLFVSETVVTLNDFTDELTLHCFSFMSASFIASIATVSHRFSKHSFSMLCSLFGTNQGDGSLVEDPCKMYMYYHQVEKSPSIKALTMRCLNSMRPTSLSCDSFKLNSVIDDFSSRLFRDHKGSILDILDSGSGGMELGLNTLMINYGSYSKICLFDHKDMKVPSEGLIDAVGLEVLASKIEFEPVEKLFFGRDEFKKGGHAYRKKLYKLYQSKLSKTLQVLAETGNIFESRINTREIEALELVALTDLATNEDSIEPVLELAERFIKDSTFNKLASALECIRSTSVLVRILQLRQLTPVDHRSLSLVLYMREDAREIFCALNDPETITDPLMRLVYGILTGMDDETLMGLSDTLTEGHEIAGRIAAYNKKSPALLLALKSQSHKVDYYVPAKCLDPLYPDHVVLDYSLSDTIALLGGQSIYWQFISIPRKLEYFEYMLDHADDLEVEHVMDALNECAGHISTDSLYRKFLRRSILLGKKAFHGGIPPGPYLQEEINMEISLLLKNGLNCSRMFALDPGHLYFLRSFQTLFYKEILSWENGLDLILGHLCSNNEEDSLETNTIRFIVICLYNNIGFEMPVELRPLILLAVSTAMKTCRVLDIQKTAWRLDMTFGHSASVPAPSSFHAAVAEIISTPAYSRLADALGFHHLYPNDDF